MKKLNIDDASISPTSETILSKISEFDIFKKYCPGFKEIGKSFCSELRDDRNPSAVIYINDSNSLRYKDFGDGSNFSCFDYIMAKYNCKYIESLNIISNDFNLSNFKPNLSNTGIIFDKSTLPIIHIPKEKSVIEIVSQPFNIIDYNYWSQYGISFDILNEYNVFSAKYVYLTKGNKRVNFEYRKSNPCYAYRFTNDGNYSYKIYWPLSEDRKRKWLFSGGSKDDIEGYDQLPLNGDILILTKSLKDCMCYNVIGYPAISLQGEGNSIEYDFVQKLLKRFNKIVINYDNDETGILCSNKIKDQYGFESILIDGSKDLSDYIKDNNIEKAKEMIKHKLNE